MYIVSVCSRSIIRPHNNKKMLTFPRYGDNTNYIYFMYHGFIPDENPFECVDIDLPDLFHDLNDDRDEGKTELQLIRSNRIQVAKAIGFRQPSICLRNELNMFEQIASYMRARTIDESSSFKDCRDDRDTYTPSSLRSCVPSFDSNPMRKLIRKKLKKYKRKKNLNDASNNRERWAIRYVDVRMNILQSLLDYITKDASDREL